MSPAWRVGVLVSLAAACGADVTLADPLAVVIPDEGDAGQVHEPMLPEDGDYVSLRPDNPGEDFLLACSTEEPCHESLSQRVEGDREASFSDYTLCVLEGLEQRRPGRYRHQTDHTWGNGSMGVNHTVVVTEQGTALHTWTPYAHLFDPEGRFELPPPELGRRCVLHEPGYFSACRDGLMAEQDEWLGEGELRNGGTEQTAAGTS